MLRITLLLLLVSQAPVESPEVKKELAKHQGVWATESFHRDGKDTPDAIARSITRTVDGDHVVWKRNGKSFSGSTIVLDPTADPKTIDILADGGPARDKRVLGIYKLEDDRLTICTSDADQPRPKDFKAEKDSRRTLMVFKREKAK
ncbi:MAG: TIGR03067 domain-containing protein [Paludisphaera borealis]|uniref:TIGR03067 domain-containing protein n=1 Tax=Paludisphaera borealis TaxID=1387353 RepID=UPI00284530A2|nr:TIGR03067 domain-containing protein [Paludisphaera borealis]MDR3621222.1 TIGR03067 domain-containing protein [Paludisphaera borealis]